MLVTFDLFSALLDSRTGGSAAFGQIVAAHGWDVAAEALYDRWDVANKASQRDETEWLPFTEHSRRALAAVYADLALDGDADADTAVLLGSVGSWPLWPDVEAGLDVVRLRRPGHDLDPDGPKPEREVAGVAELAEVLG